MKSFLLIVGMLVGAVATILPVFVPAPSGTAGVGLAIFAISALAQCFSEREQSVPDGNSSRSESKPASPAHERQLSGAQIAALAEKLARVDLSGIVVRMSYLPGESRARDLAGSLRDALVAASRHQLSCPQPGPESAESVAPGKTHIVGTRVFVAAHIPSGARLLAEALKEILDEVATSGPDGSWPIPAGTHLRIVVGKR